LRRAARRRDAPCHAVPYLVRRRMYFFRNGGSYGDRGARVYNGVWGGAPRRVQELSPWSANQGASPLKLNVFQMRRKIVYFLSCNLLKSTFEKYCCISPLGLCRLVGCYTVVAKWGREAQKPESLEFKKWGWGVGLEHIAA